jgi:hypothetical protein
MQLRSLAICLNRLACQLVGSSATNLRKLYASSALRTFTDSAHECQRGSAATLKCNTRLRSVANHVDESIDRGDKPASVDHEKPG